MKKKTNNGEAGNTNPGFKILLARRKIFKYVSVFAFLMIVPPLSSLIFFDSRLNMNTVNSSNQYLFALKLILFAPLPILFGYIVFDYYLLTSYTVNGYLKFENEGLEYYFQKKIWTRIDYKDIARIEFNYVAHEKISYFSFSGDPKRTHGADNTLNIIQWGGGKTHCNFLCKKHRDIKKIKELMRFLKNTKGIEILYSEKGKTLSL